MLGPYALTGLLLDALTAGSGGRVVSLSSITHKNAHLDFGDLMSEHGYRASSAYGRSKLATTLFGLELDRRLRAAGLPVVSALAHPGLTRTNLTPRAWEHRGRFGRLIAGGGLVATLSVELGARPQLRAATDPDAHGGQFYGPLWVNNGPPVRKPIFRRLGMSGAIRKLWEVSERETGVPLLPSS
jgi:NAD(P)-dependent dehydrogenase (short-subunit alcohol dehydrogenase family)